MSTPQQPGTNTQEGRFGRALCKRLGLDPAIVAADYKIDGSGETTTLVTLTVGLPADEVEAMWNDAAS